jgi:predicted alpha/beta-hydrolase family hydrolase
LHAPGRPERRRTEHLITLRTPTVFVHGTRDPFGLLDEMEEARALMPGPTRLIAVRDAGHDLGARADGAFATAAVGELLALLG